MTRSQPKMLVFRVDKVIELYFEVILQVALKLTK